MNFFDKFMPRKKRIVEFYLKSLADAYKYGGIHNYEFSESGITYKPQNWMIDFSIKVLRKISKLGLSDQAIAKKMNSHNIFNLLCAEIEPWSTEDVSLILSASESGLILIN